MTQRIRIGIIGAGENTRRRHIPGLRALDDVEIVGVVNRTANSTRRAARELGIARTYDDWPGLVADDEIDAVVIGTWPYLHAPATIVALEAGKHVLTEARMAMNSAEGRSMLQASRKRPDRVAMIVPSPFGLSADRLVRRLLGEGFIGPLREAVVLGTHDSLLDASAPLHWRQVERYSGLNVLQLGILHETLIRWVPDPIRVLAQSQTFVRERVSPETRQLAAVERPDAVHVLTQLADGAQGLYHLSGVSRFGPGPQIHLYGAEGTLKYDFTRDQVSGGRRGDQQLRELDVPKHEAGGWRVEAEFVGAIRGLEPVRYTDFETGVRYMEFTEAVATSAMQGRAVALPLPA